ncbi:MAG TPA: hypothetical protein PLH93_05025, partial [Flavobacteriales bacterium]|nr:hypothetical protein [Flavobacteriales bacterium]
MAAPLTTPEILDLRRALSRTTGPERGRMLEAAMGRPLRSSKALKEWHDLLLFVLAHPADPAEHDKAEAALARLMERARSGGLGTGLTNSGVAGTPIQGTYSLSLV